jgi:hypothetical protein
MVNLLRESAKVYESFLLSPSSQHHPSFEETKRASEVKS